MVMDDRETRRKQRQGWPIARTSLAKMDVAVQPDTTAEDRLSIMWRLALDAWTWVPGGVPTYTRAQTPGRVLRAKRGP
jgi:hypothetical protein